MGNVQTLKDAYAAAANHNVDAVLAVFDPAIEWREADGHPYQPDGRAWVGVDAVRTNLFGKLNDEWDGFTVTPATYHDAGDTVVVECRYTGVHNTTGKRLDAQACHVWRFRDGRVTGFQQYADTAHLYDTMGAGIGVRAARNEPVNGRDTPA